MDVEVAQLDRRYETLRTRSAPRERRLLASLAEIGQQAPLIVVRDDTRLVLVDGYKRVRALARLGQDVAHAVEWSLSEAEALVLERLLRMGDADSAVEQGWFLLELTTRFGLCFDELARRFDRTKSWVSRRIALVNELPQPVQDHVRTGAIGAHAAMRHLVPLARANQDDCLRLSAAIAPLRLSNRQVGELCATYLAGNVSSRALLLRDPKLVLAARAERVASGDDPASKLLDDLHILSAVARRAQDRLARGALDGSDAPARERTHRACHDAHGEIERLLRRFNREAGHAGSSNAVSDSSAS